MNTETLEQIPISILLYKPVKCAAFLIGRNWCTVYQNKQFLISP